MQRIADYMGQWKGRWVTVIGAGMSNTPLISMLLQAGAKVTIRDRKETAKQGPQAEEWQAQGAVFCLGSDYLEGLTEEVIFRTPGLSPNTPQLLDAQRRGSVLSSEMEVFFQICPSHILGITGSDGKTTTATIVAKCLTEGGHRVYLGGNIGKPLLAEADAMGPEDYVVLELSSFQLMTMRQSPSVGVITNLSPNHLDYHHSMEEYVQGKKQIFLHQKPEDRLVLNWDCLQTRSLAQEAVGDVIWFSRGEPIPQGVHLQDRGIWVTNQGGSRLVLPLELIQLPGQHNVENYMAAIAALDGLVSDDCIQRVARTFRGVEHRIELVREVDGVRYYNDSIGTSPSRTIACLNSFPQKIILIAGGYDKGIPFQPLAEKICCHVKQLILTGDTAALIQQAVEQVEGDHPPMVQADHLEQAVQLAREAAVAGDVVVLSPACAAFDRYANFMERGQAFRGLVEHL